MREAVEGNKRLHEGEKSKMQRNSYLRNFKGGKSPHLDKERKNFPRMIVNEGGNGGHRKLTRIANENLWSRYLSSGVLSQHHIKQGEFSLILLRMQPV